MRRKPLPDPEVTLESIEKMANNTDLDPVYKVCCIQGIIKGHREFREWTQKAKRKVK